LGTQLDGEPAIRVEVEDEAIKAAGLSVATEEEKLSTL